MTGQFPIVGILALYHWWSIRELIPRLSGNETKPHSLHESLTSFFTYLSGKWWHSSV